MSFPQYPDYKNSGVEWLGEVPAHWDIKPLKYVTTYNDEVLSESTPKNRPIKYVEISDVDEQRGITRWSEHTFATAPSRARRVLRGGDVLISTVRTYLRAIAPVPKQFGNFIGSTGFASIRPVHGRYHSALLGYALRAEWFISSVIARSVGISYPAINASDLVALAVPIPPWEEQKAIATFLDQETARIDALVEEQQRLIELLKEKRQAVISHAVTKGLDPDVPMKDSGVEWLGRVPAHWEVMAIKRLSVVKRGASPRPIEDPIYFDDNGDYGWVRIADVSASDGELHSTQQTLSALGSSLSVKLQPGQLLVSIAGTVGKPCITRIKACIHDGFVYFPELSIDARFLFTIFDSELCYKGLGKMGTQLNLNTDTVGGIKAAVPSKNEIEGILLFLQNELKNIDELSSQAQQVTNLLSERRTALISAAVTGKIDVRNWQASAESEAESYAIAAEPKDAYEANSS